MFSSDNNIESIHQLVVEFKKYIELQKQYTRLELTEKLSVLLSTLIIIFIAMVLCIVALFYFSMTFVFFLSSAIGYTWSFCLMGLLHLLIFAGIYWGRKRLIIEPMVRFIAKLFLNKE